MRPLSCRHLLALCAVLSAVSHSAMAQLPPRPAVAPTAQPAPPPKPLKEEDLAKILTQVNEISKTRDEKMFGYLSSVIRELREAGTSGDKAFALWLDCIKDVEYDQRGRGAAEFSEWKRRQTKDSNRERDEGLRLQVQWLAIVLMETHAKTDAAKSEAISAAASFLDTMVEQAKKNEGNLGGPAGENVMGSVFARRFKLDTGGAKQDGAGSPGDIDAIYDRMILPFLRSSKQPASLMNAWARRIAQQTALAEAKKFPEAKEKFMTEKLPELKWGQTRDLFQLGQEESAAPNLLSIIKANMAHRRAGEWIVELKGLLQKKATPSALPAGEATPAPATPAPSAP